MKASTLRDIMVANNITNNDLTAIIDKSPRQIASYLSGAQPIPRAEALIMRAIDERVVDLDWVLDRVVIEIKESKEDAA